MAWIRVVGLSEATGLLKDLYHKYFVASGVEDNITQVSSLNVKALRLNHELYSHLMRGKGELTRPQREMIALLVSSLHECHY